MAGGYDRRKRIRRLKKIILGTVAAAIIIPVIVSILLGVRVVSLRNRVKELEAMLLTEKEKNAGAGVFTLSSVEESDRNQEKDTQEMEGEGAQAESTDIQKEVYFTFDDGPSANTDEILDILKEYDVRATFFVVGKTDEHSVRMYQRIVDEGHTLAMHSYSHKYDEIYASRESYVEDLTKLQEYLYQITGVWPRFCRFPGGSSNTVSNVDMTELIEYLDENGITYFDWNISSGDAVREDLSVDTIVQNCVGKLDNVNIGMILMHDANDKITTVEALPEVIKAIRERGDTAILPITDETKPVQHVLSNNIN
ncbi:polysaccharide deacetylase [Parablautia intestinalis]|jgi:peptidoglycan/xylan/chitin deacetylase (PgdA/CDA1 family)|uniref:Polysaccharide deacetylase n=1 Tax=Parablautia intestinalis TaxID=2320100 RepID=A0A3A9AQM4_9FIRM|nr:polysaccharide deacetylase family protein [Parablautia intestinalis]MCI8614297.1 polysaccharide deacetylase [Lachnospiraceae bacterium]MDE7048318.1 polysaccharide deacetylase [Lachnospiraceae bacterium]RKI93678.1 polysaccharide deacetylase [Parablautia intestinalis]